MTGRTGISCCFIWQCDWSWLKQWPDLVKFLLVIQNVVTVTLKPHIKQIHVAEQQRSVCNKNLREAKITMVYTPNFYDKITVMKCLIQKKSTLTNTAHKTHTLDICLTFDCVAHYRHRRMILKRQANTTPLCHLLLWRAGRSTYIWRCGSDMGTLGGCAPFAHLITKAACYAHQLRKQVLWSKHRQKRRKWAQCRAHAEQNKLSDFVVDSRTSALKQTDYL